MPIKKTFEFNLTNVRKIRNDEVRATYTLTDISGLDQVVELQFSLFDNTSQMISEFSDSQNLTADSTETLNSIIPINETAEGDMSLKVDLNSEVYSSSVEEAIVFPALWRGTSAINLGSHFCCAARTTSTGSWPANAVNSWGPRCGPMAF